MDEQWKSFRVDTAEGAWEPASYNVRTEDGREYGRWRRVLRKDRHGLTVISRYRSPPGKAWKIVGRASAPPEEPTESDRAWFFKLFSLRGMIDGIERMCFFTYLQKAEDTFESE